MKDENGHWHRTGVFPPYGPFYNVMGSHDRVDRFMFAFHGLGCGPVDTWRSRGANAKTYLLVRDLYDFWRSKGFMSQKQIKFAYKLLGEMGELQ